MPYANALVTKGNVQLLLLIFPEGPSPFLTAA
jgi:hypothetical protein